MELTQALDNLKKDLLKKQSESDILNLAISTLENKFAPELKVLENAQNEIAEKQAVIVDNEAKLAEKEQTIVTQTALIDSLQVSETPVGVEKAVINEEIAQ